MIGVITSPADEWVVREFFELFKTPWEFHQVGQQYDVVLCAGNAKLDGVKAKLCLQYSGGKTAFDTERKVQIETRRQGAELSFLGDRLPIYGATLTFPHERTSILNEKGSGEPAVIVDRSGKNTFARIGYDLFREIQILLVKGQPPANAGVPTLELHIAVLRDLITGCGVPLVEIPPVPGGSEFIVCLTHDLDHASIRRHKFDATILGFLYRATLGSAVNVARGRMSASKLFKNWAAAAKLPFIYVGVAEDFWYQFDKYLDLEKGRPSTFFVIPFAHHPGKSSEGSAPRARGAAYDISHIAGKIQRLLAAGCEIGLHGIDAWLESNRGRAEALRISEISKTADLGVRMHWLYSDENSPAVLEEAGFSYDSTVGYNGTVGYRAGTSQVFKPFGAARLLELPLHVMDTALFYPSHLNLSEREAWEWLTPFFDNATRYGGVLTVNWHDRSIAPERQWGDFYQRLLAELTVRGAWFCTAAQAVSWFRKRRSVVFEKTASGDYRPRAKVVSDTGGELPGLRLRLHPARMSPGLPGDRSWESYTETSLDDCADIHVRKLS